MFHWQPNINDNGSKHKFALIAWPWPYNHNVCPSLNIIECCSNHRTTGMVCLNDPHSSEYMHIFFYFPVDVNECSSIYGLNSMFNNNVLRTIFFVYIHEHMALFTYMSTWLCLQTITHGIFLFSCRREWMQQQPVQEWCSVPEFCKPIHLHLCGWICGDAMWDK